MSIPVYECWDQNTLQVNISVGVALTYTSSERCKLKTDTLTGLGLDLDRTYRLKIANSIRFVGVRNCFFLA